MQMCRGHLLERTLGLGFLAVGTKISKLHRYIAPALHMYAYMTERCLKFN